MAAEIKYRKERKRIAKLVALAEEIAITAATVDALHAELAFLPKPKPPLPSPPKSYQFVPRIPTPLAWAKEEELEDKVLCGLVPTAMTDASASSNCGAPPPCVRLRRF